MSYEFQINRKSSTGSNSPNAGLARSAVAAAAPSSTARRSAPNLSSMLKGADGGVDDIPGAYDRLSLLNPASGFIA